MRHLVLAFLAIMALIPAALAKQFDLPDANPAISVSVPDSWKPEEIDNGVEGTSPDDSSYIALETTLAKDLDEAINDDFTFLKKNGVTIDPKSPTRDEFTVNGLPIVLLHWKGKDEDGATSVNLFIVGVTNNLLLLVTTWATPDGEKANSVEGRGIIASLKRSCTDCPAPTAPVVTLGKTPAGTPPTAK